VGDVICPQKLKFLAPRASSTEQVQIKPITT